MTNLKFLREENGLTQNQLCEKIKQQGCYIDRTTYSKYETGKNEMSYDLLIFFARFFNTTTDFILGLNEISSVQNNFP